MSYTDPCFGSNTVQYDGNASFIAVVCRGLWSVEFADDHFTALYRLADRQPNRHTGLRVLVDLRDWPVQVAATAERVRYWSDRLYSASDRVAMLVASSLVKAQMRRLRFEPQHEFFLSELAARTWLFAYAAPAEQAARA